jgi:hypothetical protein
VRRRRRIPLPPSTGHKLVRLVTTESGRLDEHATECGLELAVNTLRDSVVRLAGADRAEWASEQLKSLQPPVRRGWPKPAVKTGSLSRKRVSR